MNPVRHERVPRRHDDGESDSLDVILEYARQAYGHQHARLESYRTWSGTLLAFATILVTVSGGASPRAGWAILQALGTLFVLLAALLFLAVASWPGLRLVPSIRWLSTAELSEPVSVTRGRLLRSLIVAMETNERLLRRITIVLSTGLLWLLLGTFIIGARLTLLLL